MDNKRPSEDDLSGQNDVNKKIKLENVNIGGDSDKNNGNSNLIINNNINNNNNNNSISSNGNSNGNGDSNNEQQVELIVPSTVVKEKKKYNKKPKDSVTESNDQEKLTDAVLAAGIDLKAEENLLAVSSNNANAPHGSGISASKRSVRSEAFLNPRQLAAFMRKVAAESGLKQIFDSEREILELISSASETYMSDIITNAVVYSRHRRRPITSKTSHSSTPRSDISKALREIATRQKEQEEKRVQKRIALGIDAVEDKQEKAGAEETLHRAANATAAMMTSSKKKKYSWMTGASGSNNNAPKTNSAIASRGDSGIRFREAREEQAVVVKDLIAALENRNIGVDKTLTKAYNKL